VQRLLQPHDEFERLRSFHDVLEIYFWLRYDIGLLLYAVLLHGYCGLVQIVLLENGADVNAQGGHYGNAQQVALMGGHQAIVALLVEKGADVNAQGGFISRAPGDRGVAAREGSRRQRARRRVLQQRAA
jgi:ankyrin repeat protein